MGRSPARRLSARTHLVVSGGSVVALLGSLTAGLGFWPAASPGGAASADEQVYVASTGVVTVYPATSRGPVSPARIVPNPKVPNTFWDPWGVALDRSGHLYVQSFLSDATSFVFPFGATTPSRIFRADGPDTRAIAVDGRGYEYIASGEAGSRISVVAPGASGSPSQLYGVTPLRSFPSDEGGFQPWPDILSTDDHGDFLFASARGFGNAVEVFQGGASGSPTPLRVIAGPRTDLGSCSSGACDNVAVAFSQQTDQIVVAVSSPSGSRLCTFGEDARGDVRPRAVISGTSTGLTGRVVTGIAASPSTGEIYAMVRTSQFGGRGRVEVFGSGATGNAAPVRSFTDAGSDFDAALGIAVR